MKTKRLRRPATDMDNIESQLAGTPYALRFFIEVYRRYPQRPIIKSHIVKGLDGKLRLERQIDLPEFSLFNTDKLKLKLMMDCSQLSQSRQPEIVGVALEQREFEVREEKCSFCMDEKFKRSVEIRDDAAHRRVWVLLEDDWFEEELRPNPKKLVLIISAIFKSLGIDYTPVRPVLFVPSLPEPDPALEYLTEALMGKKRRCVSPMSE